MRTKPKKSRKRYYLALYKPIGKTDIEFPIKIDGGVYRLVTQGVYATALSWWTAMFHYLRFRLYSDRAKLKLFKYRKTFGRLEIKKLRS
ncbi:MAG: hypothetical protein V4722_04375 [Bacteroidota bacterium]